MHLGGVVEYKMVIKIIISGLIALVLSLILGYPILKIMRKLKAGQQILCYVDAHKNKQGTPTMGGVIFILSILIVSLVFFANQPSAVVAVSAMVAYGLIGFLDDFLKIRNHRNLGLKAYQKIISQAGIAIILSLFTYFNGNFGRQLILPFTDITIDIGYWIIPLVFLLYVSTTNAVNLLDGLDGLATSVSSVIFVSLSLMSLCVAIKSEYFGNWLQAENAYALSGVSLIAFASLLAFICYNCFPAKIFMGDTGSLALGGLMASVFAFSGQLLLIFVLGLVLIVTCFSVILQVLYFKITKGKRIWLMTPLHHHFQYKGVAENRITAVYTVITVILGLISVISALCF